MCNHPSLKTFKDENLQLYFQRPFCCLCTPIYGYVALVCFLNARGKYDAFAHIGTLIFCFLFGLKLFFARDGVMAWFNQHEAESLVQSMKATKPWIEQSREFGGLLIISIVISINMVINKKSRS